MTQFNARGSSVKDASSKLAVQQVCTLSSVQDRISALEGNLQGAVDTASSSHTPKPELRKIFAATPILNVGPSSLQAQSCKPAKTQRHTDCSSMPSLPNNLVMKSQKPNYITTCASHNKFQPESSDPSVLKKKRLPALLVLGSPPPKPDRPPSVDLHQFGGNRMSLNDGPGMKNPRPVALKPLHSYPPSNHAAALSLREQLVDEEIYDDCIMNPRLLPLKGHPPNRAEVDFIEKINKDLEKRIEQAGKSKNHQEGKSRKKHTNHDTVPKTKQVEPKGTIVSEEQKQQKAKKKKGQENKKPVHVIERGKRRGEKIILNTDDKKNESVDTSHSYFKQQDETGSDAESDDYDDIGALAVSGFEAQNFEEDIYDDVAHPDTRFSALTEMTREDCIYEVN